MAKNLLAVLLALAFFSPLAHAKDIPDPCEGLLALLDRPTIGNSPCVVKTGKVLTEFGMQYQHLKEDNSNTFWYPQGEFRFGLPLNNELIIATPSYFNQHFSHEQKQTGYSSTIVGLKHEFPYTATWLYALEGLFTLPSGSPIFGNESAGYQMSILINYTISPSLSLLNTFAAASQTPPTQEHGTRFASFIPDIVLTWIIVPRFQTYYEFVGTTKTDFDRGWGSIIDFGGQFLVTKNVEVDFELGRHFAGNYFNGIKYYATCGGTLQF